MKNSDSCKIYKKCGACQLRNMTYEEQLSFKMSKVIKLLGRWCHVDEIIPMSNPARYRNKAQAAFYQQGDRVFAGIYQSSTGKIVRRSDCVVETKIANKIIGEICNIMNELHIRAFNPANGRGFLRHVLVRQGFATGEIMVVLVSGSAMFPKEALFISLLTERIPQITTVVHNINDTQTPLWLSDKERVLYGPGYITDVLCHCRFIISPRSFYQINPIQTEVLYNKAMELAGLTGNEKVLDAYSGIGTIGIIAAKKSSAVHCTEVNKSAVADAAENAALSGVSNIKFYNLDAAEFMKGAILRKHRYDVVFVDPPRAGCSKNFLSRLMSLSPKKVVYISCNPETLARDIAYLKGGGYRLRAVQPVDMFPHTNHVETVILLSRKDVHERIKFDVNVEDLHGRASSTATYSEIKAYILEKYGLKVSSLYIAQIKDRCGFEKRDNYNIGEGKSKELICPPEKEQAIMDAFRHFGMLRD